MVTPMSALRADAVCCRTVAAVPRQVKAVLLKRIAEEIRAVRDGPFLPLSQEPAVRAILLLLGGAGGISTVEFLFLSGR